MKKATDDEPIEYPINDKLMADEMINDLIENYKYTVEEAKEWVMCYGDKVVDNMWDAYSHFLEENTQYKG